MNLAHGSSHSHERKKQRSGVCLCESGTLVPNQSSQGSDLLWHTPWSRFPPSPDTRWAIVAKILPVWHHSRAGWCSQLCQWCPCTKKYESLSGVKKITNRAPSQWSVSAWWWFTQSTDLVHDSQHNRAPGPRRWCSTWRSKWSVWYESIEDVDRITYPNRYKKWGACRLQMGLSHGAFGLHFLAHLAVWHVAVVAKSTAHATPWTRRAPWSSDLPSSMVI